MQSGRSFFESFRETLRCMNHNEYICDHMCLRAHVSTIRMGQNCKQCLYHTLNIRRKFCMSGFNCCITTCLFTFLCTSLTGSLHFVNAGCCMISHVRKNCPSEIYSRDAMQGMFKLQRANLANHQGHFHGRCER